jgi:hypothetical protein
VFIKFKAILLDGHVSFTGEAKMCEHVGTAVGVRRKLRRRASYIKDRCYLTKWLVKGWAAFN